MAGLLRDQINLRERGKEGRKMEDTENSGKSTRGTARMERKRSKRRQFGVKHCKDIGTSAVGTHCLNIKP